METIETDVGDSHFNKTLGSLNAESFLALKVTSAT